MLQKLDHEIAKLTHGSFPLKKSCDGKGPSKPGAPPPEEAHEEELIAVPTDVREILFSAQKSAGCDRCP
jgi:hypothetical protein